MMNKYNYKNSDIIQDISAKTLIGEIKHLYSVYFSGNSCKQLLTLLKQVKKIFDGKYNGYQACNTNYHNFDHTKQVLLATIRILDGYHISNQALSESLVNALLIAALFHDIGYIQKENDTNGTGAKFTADHVARSIIFLKENKDNFDLLDSNLMLIEKLIYSTELNFDFMMIPFESESEKIAGAILGTADILGQMSDRAYLEKLLFLYYEFREAKIFGYNTEFDMLRKTMGFYEYAKKRLTESFFGIYQMAGAHFKHRFSINKNLYTEALDNNISYLKKIIDDDTSNFRTKLKRGKWVNDTSFHNSMVKMAQAH